MLTIYHVPITRSVRPIWLCYELELPVEIVRIDFSQTWRDTPEWRAISPAGKVPAMTDGEITMFESGAMVDYILERYGEGRLRPAPGTAESALYHQWCWFSEATLIRPLGIARLVQDKPDAPETLAEEGLRKLMGCIATVEDALSGRDHLLGSEFCAADIMMGYSVGLLAHFKLLDAQFPNLRAYLDRIRARPAFQRAMKA